MSPVDLFLVLQVAIFLLLLIRLCTCVYGPRCVSDLRHSLLVGKFAIQVYCGNIATCMHFYDSACPANLEKDI